MLLYIDLHVDLKIDKLSCIFEMGTHGLLIIIINLFLTLGRRTIVKQGTLH